MTLVVPKAGSVIDLEARRTGYLINSVMGLFQNNKIPTVNTILADLTEASYSGYARQTQTWPNAAFLNPAGFAQVDGGTLIFSHNGGGAFNTVYGYFLLKNTGELLWVERFPSPVVMAVLGTSILVTTSLTYLSLFTG